MFALRVGDLGGLSSLIFGRRVPRTVLALEGLVRLAGAPLLDAVVAFGFEAVEGLLLCQRIGPAGEIGGWEWRRTWRADVGCMMSVV